MRKLPLLIFDLIAFTNISCDSNKQDLQKNQDLINQKPKIELVSHKQDSSTFSQDNNSNLVDEFSDSTQIGKGGQYKIMLRQKNFDDNIAVVYFSLYENQKGNWAEIQNDNLNKTADLMILPRFEDFNNDGFNDLSINYEASGNGANDIRLLLLFDPAKEQLQLIKNATAYSNLAFNKKTNALTSLSVNGNSSTTTFFDLKNNRLIETAIVNFDGETIESYRIKNNVQTLLDKQSYKGDPTSYIRFTNFNPIEEE